MADYDPQAALDAIWELVKRANQYVEQNAPWTLAKTAKGGDAEAAGRLDSVLYNLAESLRLLAVHLAPFLPATADGIAEQLGRADAAESPTRRRSAGAAPRPAARSAKRARSSPACNSAAPAGGRGPTRPPARVVHHPEAPYNGRNLGPSPSPQEEILWILGAAIGFLDRKERITLVVAAIGTIATAIFKGGGRPSLSSSSPRSAWPRWPALVGDGTDQLGHRFGPNATGVLQSALGNLPELFISIFALRAGLVASCRPRWSARFSATACCARRRVPRRRPAPRRADLRQERSPPHRRADHAGGRRAGDPHAGHAARPARRRARGRLSVICAVVLLIVFAASIPVSLGGGGGASAEQPPAKSSGPAHGHRRAGRRPASAPPSCPTGLWKPCAPDGHVPSVGDLHRAGHRRHRRERGRKRGRHSARGAQPARFRHQRDPEQQLAGGDRPRRRSLVPSSACLSARRN